MNAKTLFATVLFIIVVYQSKAQNLIINPGAEFPTSMGWTIVSQGSTCYTSADWRIQGNQSGFPAANGGDFFFYPGCDINQASTYQIVDVSAMATAIDNGNIVFNFSGFMQVYPQTPPDSSQILVEYLDASNNLLYSYDTKLQANQGVWTQYSDTKTAPSGTRKVRITLNGHVGTGGSLDAYFDDLSLTALYTVPLKLISFTTVVNRNQEVEATWETAAEVNNDHFLLERSQDLKQWQTVQIVKSTATSSAQNQRYTATDKFPFSGQSYYRLVQVDKDGMSTISLINTVRIDGNNKIALTAYPNPATDRLIIEGTAGIFSNLRIFNSIGQDVTRNAQLSQDNSSKVELNISLLKPGVYFIKAGKKSASFLKK